MGHFLAVVREHGGRTEDVLLAEGHPLGRIIRKAEAAGKKNFIDWGVVCTRPWLTDKGEEVLAQWEQTSTGTSPMA